VEEVERLALNNGIMNIGLVQCKNYLVRRGIVGYLQLLYVCIQYIKSSGPVGPNLSH